MECKPLMVGDWVQHANGNYFRVTRIDKRGDGSTHFACGCPHLWEYNNKFSPIPLTAEILEKNGFVLIEKEKGAYGVNIAPYYTRDDVPFEVFCDGEPFAIWFKDPVNIEFVHQLQHAIRLCGIDKEIEL